MKMTFKGRRDLVLMSLLEIRQILQRSMPTSNSEVPLIKVKSKKT